MTKVLFVTEQAKINNAKSKEMEMSWHMRVDTDKEIWPIFAWAIEKSLLKHITGSFTGYYYDSWQGFVIDYRSIITNFNGQCW